MKPDRPSHWPRCRHKAYHLTCVQHEHLLARSGNCCEICGKPADRSGFGLILDHDHQLGWLAVRGLVCPRCNTVLGRVDKGFREPDEATARYLANPWHAAIGITNYACPAKCQNTAHLAGTTWRRSGSRHQRAA